MKIQYYREYNLTDPFDKRSILSKGFKKVNDVANAINYAEGTTKIKIS